MNNVVIVGPGRLGTLLGVSLVRAGLRITGVAGGSPSSRKTFQSKVAGAREYESPEPAAAQADLIVLSVPDDALDAVATRLAVSGALDESHHVIHVAGSVGLNPLRRIALTGARIAACHPAMTIPTSSDDPDVLLGVAWAVTAARGDWPWASDFVTRLGGDPRELPEHTRDLYHAGVTIAANSVGAAVATARRLLIAAQIDQPDSFLRPLVSASVENVLKDGAQALTGPITRGDVNTIARHLNALERDTPELLDAYRWLAKATLAPVRAALDDETLAAFDGLLTRRLA